MAVLTRGHFLGPLLSNQLQGFPALTPILDYRTADPKRSVRLYTGLVPISNVTERLHLLGPAPEYYETASNVQPLNLEMCFDSTRVNLSRPALLQHMVLNPPVAFSGPTIKVALGSLLYGRSGDKGPNVNVGLFFPVKHQTEQKWQRLRTWLTTPKLIG